MFKGKFLCLFLGVCTVPFQQGFAAKPSLDTVYQWSQLEFDYESQYDRQADIDLKIFIPGRPAPIDTDVYYSEDNRQNKIFITIPRFQPGIPVTLGTVSSKMYKGNPVITPYPSWKWHRSPQSCGAERIVSVYRVLVDECDRLWVLDTGKLLEEQTCPPQILAFDLKTNKLVHRSDIPSSVREPRSLVVTPIVDIRNKQCADAFVYIADCQTYSIIVHDVKTGAFWQATDKTMYPYPTYGTFNIKGDSFDLMDGVLGMSLEQYNPSGDRRLFYHALSSPTENYIYTSHLRNQSLFMHDPTSSPHLFYTYRGERRTQSAAEAIDKNGVMFFGLMSDVKIACWNSKGEYGDRLYSDIVASDPVTLQFASGVKVVKNRKGIQELWILTSRFQKVAADTLSTSEVNFRILAGKVDDILYGTNCKGKKHNGGVGGGGYGLITTPRG
ncbi:major royal jelly protein 3 isoform X2 [Anoplophora glabripennis]|nr:major royal jelly protein 3 isoform X2 [Anoplophora glabripennis]